MAQKLIEFFKKVPLRKFNFYKWRSNAFTSFDYILLKYSAE